MTSTTSHRLFATLLIMLTLGVGCAGAEADLGNDRLPVLPDAGPEEDEMPAIPVFEGAPAARQPYSVITLRGNAPGADRVIIEVDGMNPMTKAVGTQGTFCMDVPGLEPGSYTFTIRSHARGMLSEALTTTVDYDPGSPVVPGAQTCTGADPAGCSASAEVCGNLRDDDCNGLADDADPACNTCERDYLEPNGELTSPALEPGTYDGVHLCSGEEDYIGVEAKAGEDIYVKIYFTQSQGNLDLELLSADGKTVLQSSRSSDDDEWVSFKATKTDRYVVRIKGALPDDAADYSLYVRVTPAP